VAVRIEVSKAHNIYGLTGARTVPVQVLESKDGPVTLLDKVKGYYHTLIVLVSFLLILLNQLLTMKDVVPPDLTKWIDLGILALTPVFTLLKSNEQWVDGL